MTYPTRRIACWGKAKENRIQHFMEVMSARERGVPVVTGSTGHAGVLAGFGEIAYLPGEPYAAELTQHPELADRCLAAVDQRGYAGDLCGYIRLYWGSAFIGETPWGPFPRPDFVLQAHHCDGHGKWFRRVADHFGVPFFVVEHPEPSSYQQRPEQLLEYEVGQYLDLIDWTGKQLGRAYDDEKLIEAVVNNRKTGALWAEICELNRAVPAPLDMKSMLTLSNVAVRQRYAASTVAFYRELRDEVKERVRDGIAAVGNERIRLLHDNLPVWFALHLFRWMEEYGAVCVASQYQFCWGQWLYEEDGHFRAHRFEEVEQEPRPRTREEALRYLLAPGMGLGYMLGDSLRDVNMQLVRDWHCDGAVFHMNRGCQGATRSAMESRLALQRAGVPTVIYEGNSSDRRDFNESQAISRLQAFFESLAPGSSRNP